MIDTLVKLLEKLTKFGEIRESNRKNYIDRYATPTMEAAEIVYADYLKLLREIRQKLRTYKKAIPFVHWLELRRLEQLPARVRLRALLRSVPRDRWTNFEQGILGLMSGALPSFSGHTVFDIIRAVEDRGDRPSLKDRQELIEFVDRRISGIDDAWNRLCSGYSDLSTMALEPPKVPKKYLYPNGGD